MIIQIQTFKIESPFDADPPANLGELKIAVRNFHSNIELLLDQLSPTGNENQSDGEADGQEAFA